MRKRRAVFFRLLAVGIGLIVAMAVSEVLVRIVAPQMTGPRQYSYDPQLGAIPVPLQEGRRRLPGVYDYTYTNNSRGFRGKGEYAFDKHTDFRILFLGDSFTYGIGVGDRETFVALIQEALARDHSVENINAGNGGKGTDYALKFFETLGYKFHPDITCLCFFSNDFSDNEKGEYYRLAESGLIPLDLSGSVAAWKAAWGTLPAYDWVISRSHVSNLLKQAIIHRFFVVSPAPSVAAESSSPNPAYSNPSNERLTRLFVSRLAAKAKQAGGKFLVFYIPSESEVALHRETGSFSTDEVLIRGISEAYGDGYLSLTPVLSNAAEDIRALYYTEGHWTAVAHRLAGVAMARLIEKDMGGGK